MGELIQWQYFGKFGLHKHSSAKDIKLVVGEDIWSEYFTWATVRNPYSRLASIWAYVASLVAQHAHEVDFPLEAPASTRSEWSQRSDYPRAEPWSYPAVKAYLTSCGESRPFSAFLRRPELQQDSIFQPQWWGLQDESGERPAVEKIVQLEQIDAEWPGLCTRLGLPDTPLAHANRSEARFKVPPQELLEDPEDVAFVRQRFAEDFARFGYDPDVIP
jgi:hypothetical protein